MAIGLIKLLVPENILQHFYYEKLGEISGVMSKHLVEKKTLTEKKALTAKSAKNAQSAL